MPGNDRSQFFSAGAGNSSDGGTNHVGKPNDRPLNLATGTSPTVFIIDDDPQARGLMEQLARSAGLHVESFASAEEFLSAHRGDRPGCLVLDVRMPGMSGIELQQNLAQRGSLLPIIMVTGYGEVSTAVDALKRGAIDYVEKPFRPDAFLERIRAALQRDAETRRGLAHFQELTQKFSKLTDREKRVVERVVKGLTNKQIAAEFGVSSQAIDAQRNRAMEKLGAESVPELVRIAIAYESGKQMQGGETSE